MSEQLEAMQFLMDSHSNLMGEIERKDAAIADLKSELSAACIYANRLTDAKHAQSEAIADLVELVREASQVIRALKPEHFGCGTNNRLDAAIAKHYTPKAPS